MGSFISIQDYQIKVSDQVEPLSDLIALNDYSKVFVLTDNNSRAYCLPLLIAAMPELKDAWIWEIPEGESYKNLDTCEVLWESLFEYQADRQALWINLGGGVIGDMGGFVASTYKRGVDFINVPTTLLSQVDATIGGKLGVDFSNIKNGIGLFRNPKAVFVYTDFLKTLPEEQVMSGYAEIIKHGLIASQELWEQLQDVNPKQSPSWMPVIKNSLDIKKQVVEEDFLEKGQRKVLNFGHTIGHAFESCALAKEQPLLHGHAVALGIIAEAWLSNRLLDFPQAALDEVTELILKQYGDYFKMDWEPAEIMDWLQHDKKNVGEKINFTLLKAIGKAEINQTAAKQDIQNALKYLSGII